MGQGAASFLSWAVVCCKNHINEFVEFCAPSDGLWLVYLSGSLCCRGNCIAPCIILLPSYLCYDDDGSRCGWWTAEQLRTAYRINAAEVLLCRAPATLPLDYPSYALGTVVASALNLACKVQCIDTCHIRAEPSNSVIGCRQNPKSDFTYWSPTYNVAFK